jgi:hypothetical protein
VKPSARSVSAERSPASDAPTTAIDFIVDR